MKMVKKLASKIAQTINMKMMLIENAIHVIKVAKNAKQVPTIALLVLLEKFFITINVKIHVLKDMLFQAKIMLLDAKLMKKAVPVKNVQTIVMIVLMMIQIYFNVKNARMDTMKRKEIVSKIVVNNFMLTQLKRNVFVAMKDVLIVKVQELTNVLHVSVLMYLEQDLV